MLKTITNKIATNFTDEDTNIITIMDYVTDKDVKSNFINDRTKNLIVLLDNTIITGNVSINITESNLDQNSLVKSNITKIKDDEKLVKIAEIVNRLNNMDKSKTVFIYYPSLESDNSQFSVVPSKTDPGFISITLSQDTTEDLFIPGGKSFVYILEKAEQDQFRNVSLSINRDSYQNIICSPTIENSSESEYENYYSSTIVWNMTIIIGFVALMFLVFLCIKFLIETSPKKENVVTKPTAPVTLMSNGTSVSSPVESIATKLGKLRQFL